MTRCYDNLREDHTHWLCKNERYLGTECYELNDIDNYDCSRCQERREEGTLAADRSGKVIGELEYINPAGQECWEYYPAGGPAVTVYDIVFA